MLNEDQLALLGGNPVITEPFNDYKILDQTDSQVALEVLESGVLSRFLGAPGEFFLGGEKVRMLESSWASQFKVKNVISCNSWTSGLWLAIGALGLEPGSEVIVSSWTMAATATTILHWNLVPVFADIQEDSFNIDPHDVEAKITSRTRAIISPDIFGQSADIESLIILCNKYNLKLISDSAQSPGAIRNGYLAGTRADIGGYSLNYHKHIHAGEGGILVTNSDEFAHRMQLLRNHGEVYVGSEKEENFQFGILGMNMRMGEIEAAIAKNQLNKLENAISSRAKAAQQLLLYLENLEGLFAPITSPGNSHVYYVFGIRLDTKYLKLSRELILKALAAEGIPSLAHGYQNIHKLPLFKNQMTYRNNPLPYSLLSRRRQMQLKKIRLPIAEKLHDEQFIGINWCSKNFDEQEVELIGEAFQKVWRHLDELRHV